MFRRLKWNLLVSTSPLNSCLDVASLTMGYEHVTLANSGFPREAIASNDSWTHLSISLKTSRLISLKTSCKLARNLLNPCQIKHTPINCIIHIYHHPWALGTLPSTNYFITHLKNRSSKDKINMPLLIYILLEIHISAVKHTQHIANIITTTTKIP